MRLIDADKLKLISIPVYLKSEVDAQLTIEIPKGKWIIDDLDEYDCNRVWTCHCSRCNKNPLNFVSGTANWWICKIDLPKYCPNCGAEMEV